MLNQMDDGEAVAARVWDAVGDVQDADYIAPMLAQQAMTAHMTLEAVDEGLLDNPVPFLEVMDEFIQPMLDMVDGKSPLHWKNAIKHNPLISIPQPYQNTVLLGVDQHIDVDFNNAFILQGSKRRENVVLPQDWINSYGAVLIVSEHTGPAFSTNFGVNTWSFGTNFLRLPVVGPMVYDRRNEAYIRYAKKIEMDISEFMRAGKLARTPQEAIEQFAWLARKMKLRDRVLAMCMPYTKL
jgi:hypothetical protein